MRVCLMIEGQEAVGWDDWLALAGAAEAGGLDALFRSDHYLSIRNGGVTGGLDCWTTLAALAAATRRIRLGSLVSPVTFRHPAVLAKSVVTADHVSGGRVELGVGAGWFEAEHEAYGFPFPPLGERMDELERQVETVVRHWTEDERIEPKPYQRPRPPLIVGGAAKPRTVRVAVRWADEYNTTFADAETCRERRRALDEACERAGRDPASLRFSLMTGCVVGRDAGEVRARLARIGLDEPRPGMVAGTVDEVVEQLRTLADAGVERVMLQHLAHDDLETVALLGEVARALS